MRCFPGASLAWFMATALEGRRVSEVQWLQLRAVFEGAVAGERAFAMQLYQVAAGGGTLADLGATVQGAMTRPGL